MQAKLIAVMVSLVAVLALSACGSTPDTSTAQGTPDTTSPSSSIEPAAPLDLTGTWASKSDDASDTTMQATVKDSTIEINWVTPDSTSLYWTGSYEAPTEATDTYSWTSQGDTETMSSALLASQDSTKDFTYENGELTFETSALGATKTIRLHRN
ncbi:hypothetical protein [Bifidobacterium aquikefiricola]|uniref:Lipoprotein n=1 Tax=Bifidobacterium aquikefiricola TaxID=3059038 RepID=A0AB39U5B3_9BIFI